MKNKDLLRDLYLIVVGAVLFAGLVFLGKAIIVFFNGPF